MFKSRIVQLLFVFAVALFLPACGGGSGDGSETEAPAVVLNSGVVVDPYISNAVLQEIDSAGNVRQRSSGVSDASGHFRFAEPLAVGSIIEIKVGNMGEHVGDANQVILRRKVVSGDSGDLTVSPLTTLLANGGTEADLVSLLHAAGLNNFTVRDIYLDPMANLGSLTAGLTDQQLEKLQAAMAVGNYLEAVNNQPVTVSDLNTLAKFEALTSLLGSVRETLNPGLFETVKSQLAADTAVAHLTFGDFINASVMQNRTIVALVKSQLSASGRINQPAIDQQGALAVGNMMTATRSQNQVSQGYTPPALDGGTLYANNCAVCHRSLATSTKSGRSAAAIQSAIDTNRGNMGYLSTLTPAEVQAIAAALAPAPVVTPAPPNGTTLYAGNCAGCHSSLATTTKPGKTAAQIQSAIDGNIGNMGFLTSLTAAEVQAIASVLPAAPVVDPGTPPNGSALYASECAGCHAPLANTSKPGRTAAQIQTAIDSNIGNMGFISLTAEEVQAIADALPAAPVVDPGTPPDGTSLYSSNCAGCHSALATTAKPGRTATAIQTAIDANIGNMGFLSTLASAEVQAIADVLPAAPVVDPGTPPDGSALYSSSCAGCHSSLASTTKPGRTAAAIQTAIDNNTGNMGYLSTLTTAEVQAIADVLPADTGSGGPDYSDCTACHAQPPNGTAFPNTAGAHAAHQAIGGIGTNCAVCHSTAAHNGTVDLAFPAAFNASGGVATDNLDGTCSSISCHGGNTTPDWWTGSIALTTDCASCHARPSTGKHGKSDHRVSCTTCHNSSRMATHIGDPATRGYEVTPASTIGGSGTSITTYNSSSRTCVGCHGTSKGSW